MKRIVPFLPPVLVAFFCIWSVLPLFHPGFFVTDDGEWMIIRLTAFHHALIHGEFPVRWVGRLNFEYGYPVTNFLYPGLLYVGELIHLLHVSFVNSIKIVIGLSLVGSGIFTYQWLKRFFIPIIASIGAVGYLFSPYHLYDVYTRGSVGEVLALAVIVFILWQIERRSFLLSSLGIGFLILSHNTLAYLFMPVIVVYLILRKKELERRWGEYLLLLLLGIGSAAFFWIPALYDLQYTIFSRTVISNWQSYFALFPLAQPFILGIFISAVFLIQDRGDFRREIMPLFFLGVTAVPLFFSSGLSAFLWTFLPIAFIQFPFRLLAVTLLGGTFISCYMLSHAKNWLVFWSVFTIITIVISAVPFFAPKEYTNKGEGFYLTNEDSTTIRQEYTPIWVKVRPTERPSHPFMGANVQVLSSTVLSHKASAVVQVSTPTTLTFAQHYFPGWEGSIDGKKTQLSIDPNLGTMGIYLSPGQHVVEFQFKETPMRVFADIISLLSIIGIGIGSILIAKKKGWRYL